MLLASRPADGFWNLRNLCSAMGDANRVRLPAHAFATLDEDVSFMKKSA